MTQSGRTARFRTASLEEGREEEIKLDKEEELREEVRRILSSQKTVDVVRTLKAQVEDPDTLPSSVERRGTTAQGEPDDDDIPF